MALDLVTFVQVVIRVHTSTRNDAFGCGCCDRPAIECVAMLNTRPDVLNTFLNISCRSPMNLSINQFPGATKAYETINGACWTSGYMQWMR